MSAAGRCGVTPLAPRFAEAAPPPALRAGSQDGFHVRRKWYFPGLRVLSEGYFSPVALARRAVRAAALPEPHVVRDPDVRCTARRGTRGSSAALARLLGKMFLLLEDNTILLAM